MIHEPAAGPVPRGRRRQDRRDDHGRDRAAAARPGPQARGHRPQPHAGAVRPRVAPALPAGPRARRPPRGPPARPAPPVRRPLRHRRLGRHHHVPLRVRAHPAQPRPSSAPTWTASSTRCASGSPGRRRTATELTVKRLEGALLRAEERLKAKLDSAKDPGITFEATGIDYLCVDEAHGYKNLRTPSNIADAAIDGSMRASDLDMKLDYLRRRNGRRVATFATATPIANSVTEAYVMQRYLRPDLLEAAGISVFDTLGRHVRPDRHPGRAGPRGRRQLPGQEPLRPVPQRPRDAAHVARLRRRQDRRPDLNLPVPALAPRPMTASGPRDRHRRALRRPDRLRRRARASAPTASATGPSAPKKTTCSRSPATAAGPPSTCAWSACRRHTRQDRRRRRRGSPPSGVHHRDEASTWHPTAPRTRSAGRCSWCSATSAPPATAGTSTTNCATSSPRAG